MEVLQAIVKSTANPVVSPLLQANPVVYSLLQANLDKLDDNLAVVLRNWATAALEKSEQAQIIKASHLYNILIFSDLIAKFTRGSIATNLEIAITGYEVVSTVVTREAFRQYWATTQMSLGNAYLLRIRGKKADNLEMALQSYQNALTVLTREAFRQDWATTQMSLGNAYLNLYRIRGKKVENLEKAIASYQAALEVFTREDFYQDWAKTKHNLANAYFERVSGEKADNLEHAIKYFQDALEVFTGEDFYQDWASTQSSLANVYIYRIRGDKADNLERAIASFQDALKVLTPEDYRQDWARTQNNLANAYFYLGRIREDKADNLERAIASFQAALKVSTREAFPKDWAGTQMNLGLVYLDRIREDKANNLEHAIKYFQAALQVYTCDNFPYEWAMTKHNLANAYSQRIRGDKADNLKRELNACQAALQVRTREAFPQKHAETLFNLGFAYQNAQQLTKAYRAFADAIETVESLRNEIVSGSGVETDKQKLAEEWNQLYRGMVEVCRELNKPTEAIEYAERSKGRNLVELLANKNLYPKSNHYPNLEVHQTHCQQLDQLRREIPVIQRELDILTRNRESEEKYRENIKTQQQKLNRLKQQQDNLLKDIKQLDDSFRFTQQVEPIPFSDIQALIDDHTAIIQWYITNNKILAFIVTSQNRHPQVKQSSSEDSKALIDLINEYRATYYQKKDQWETHLDKLLSRLAQILHLEEILAELPQECDQLILIPHRFLHLFPLHALPIGDTVLQASRWRLEDREQKTNNSEQNAQTKNAYLIDLFPKGVRYAPSCQLLQLSQNQQRPHFNKLFAIQNPTNDSYKKLYYADLEVKSILSLFDSFQVLAKQAATEAAVKTN